MKEVVGVAREEWQEKVELESRKKVELALQEQQAVWDKRYAYHGKFHIIIAYSSWCKFLSSSNAKICTLCEMNDA